MLCIAHQFGLDYMLIFVDFLDHLLVVVDLAVILMIWLGVYGTLFLMYFVTLAWDLLTCISPWLSPEMRL